MPEELRQEEENTYILDAESATEMARLSKQDRLITKGMGGLFSERDDIAGRHDILDIACGPGAWVIEVAYSYPHIHVVGGDISRTMITYARTQASVQGLTNADFYVMDVLKRLDFPDNSFDFVNARLMAAFMPIEAWPGFMQECLRITRPAGIIRLSECEMALTNSPAFE